jgi:putative peptide zinc metalloprotease protein
MTTMADSLVNSAMRPLQVRRRPDLEAKRHLYHGRSYWVVKEPVGLNYYRFHDEEYAILNMLDGKTSLQQIKDRFQSEFAPQRITLQDLQQFIGMLHRSGLVISQATGQGRQLRRRGDEKKKRELLGKLSNVFAMRFRGIDPEGILNFLNPFTWWYFTLPALFAVVLFGLSALALLFANWHQFQSKLPTFEQFFAAHNWIYLGLTMAAVKVLHEFGHGLSCKRYGGECHEMGLMFLVFTPCLYCNVSDSWMLPNKWHRVFIGFAGMYVELTLASLATYLWWFSEPGMFNFLCLSVMFICSVSTVVFNGNPLLRFDGYYILMDLLEIPNLRQKATEILKRWFQKNCLGLQLQENPFLPHKYRFWFGFYTIASVIYRWVVVFSITMFLIEVLEPYGLQAIGRTVAVVGIIGMIVKPLWEVIKFFRTPGRASRMKRKNMTISAAIAVGLLAVIIWLPLPYHVRCAVEIQPRDSKQVFAMVPGKLVSWNKMPGDFVREGETIATLENLTDRQQLVKYIGELEEAKKKLEMLKTQMRINESRRQIDAQAEVVEAKQKLVNKFTERIKQLNVVAPAGSEGVIFPPPPKPVPKQIQEEEQLPTWSENPFDVKNQEAYFSDSDLLCLIGEPKAWDAILVVDQHDIDLVKLQHEVEIMLESSRMDTLAGKIAKISEAEMQEVSESISLQSGGNLDTEMTPGGKLRPISTSYQARVPLENVSHEARIGYRGQARIYVGWKSIGWRIYRFAAGTFRLEI